MKKITILMFALLLGVACNKTDIIPPGSDGKTVTLSATLEGKRVWNDADAALINGKSYTISEGAGTRTAVFDEVDEAETYAGLYDYSAGSVDGNTFTLTLPETQGPNVSLPAPMAASSKNEMLAFKNLLGKVSIEMKGTGTAARLEIRANSGEKLSGDMVLDLTAGQLVLEGADDAKDLLKVECGDVQLPAILEVTLPVGNYISGFTFNLYNEEEKMMTCTTSDPCVVEGDRTASVIAEFTQGPAEVAELKGSLEADANGNSSFWNDGTVINVNGAAVPMVSGGGNAEATFGPVVKADNYYALAPSSMFLGLNQDIMKVNFPTAQKFGSSIQENNPMAAVATGSEALEFKYLSGVVEVTVTGEHSLTKLELSGKNNKRIAGQGNLYLKADLSIEMASSASNSVVVSCPNSVNVASGVKFRFVIPAGDYSDGFSLTLYDSYGDMASFDVAGKELGRNVVADLGAVTWEGESIVDGNLSARGWANSYMIHKEGEYTFDTKHVSGAPIEGIAKVDWLWSTKGTAGSKIVSDVSYADGKVTFTATGEEGNALLAAFDASGKIVWSWHIWATDRPVIINYDNRGKLGDGYYFMDRNLGATDATIGGGYETYGLYYQWGRKDPFIGSTANEEKGAAFAKAGTLTVCNTAYKQAKWEAQKNTDKTGTMEFATANPMYFLVAAGNIAFDYVTWVDENYLTNDYIKPDGDEAFWNPFEKSKYDPCPPGYQIPRHGLFKTLATSMTTGWQEVSPKGYIFTTSSGVETWYPAAGHRSARSFDDVGALVYADTTVELWESELYRNHEAWSCFVNSLTVDDQTSYSGWGNGLSVRCVQIYND